jgi:hypothetical protein
MPVAPVAPLPTAGLSPEQMRQMADAWLRAKKVRRGVSVAMFDGWTVAIFAGLTLLGGLFSPVGLLLGLGMATAAYVELKAAKRLKALDPAACKTLAWNQVFLGAILFLYACYSLWTIYSGRSALNSELSKYPELSQFAVDIEQMSKLIGLLIYGTLIAVAIFGQGGTALFYLSRRKYVDAYLRETPQWILDAQRAGMPM